MCVHSVVLAPQSSIHPDTRTMSPAPALAEEGLIVCLAVSPALCGPPGYVVCDCRVNT